MSEGDRNSGTPVGFSSGCTLTLVWMLAYRDRADRDEVFAAFRAHPEWAALRTKYEVPLDIEAYMMSASDYSALK